MIRKHLVQLLPHGGFTLNVRLLDFHLARVGLFSRPLMALLGPNRRRHEELTQRHRDLAAVSNVSWKKSCYILRAISRR